MSVGRVDAVNGVVVPEAVKEHANATLVVDQILKLRLGVAARERGAENVQLRDRLGVSQLRVDAIGGPAHLSTVFASLIFFETVDGELVLRKEMKRIKIKNKIV